MLCEILPAGVLLEFQDGLRSGSALQSCYEPNPMVTENSGAERTKTSTPSPEVMQCWTDRGVNLGRLAPPDKEGQPMNLVEWDGVFHCHSLIRVYVSSLKRGNSETFGYNKKNKISNFLHAIFFLKNLCLKQFLRLNIISQQC